ncbi:hypothetical protein [Caballeronia sp. TF1N1]|uniref:hypothetical protein n=1 Tax=Caballeronia sp. TF1N1 TaxID=2878153 RepID=UPI001FD3054A|nr:hypothetical protein [Caballeronia sp. TF1N1]
MLPKPRKNLRGASEISAQYPALIALALASELRDSRHAAKKLSRWTGASERTVQDWLSGTRGPSGPHLVALARHSAAVHSAYLSMSERAEELAPNVNASVGLLREALDLLTSRAG